MKLAATLILFGLLRGVSPLKTVYITEVQALVEYSTRTYTTISTRWSTKITETTVAPTMDPLISSTLSSPILSSPSQPTTTYSSDITSTITSTQTTYTTLNSFVSEALVSHNEKRVLHKDTPDLLWSDELEKSAQDYADAYNCNGTLIHSKGDYGENLALGFNTTAAIQAWYDEIDLYDYNDAKFSEKTGHFSQLVWKKSTRVACGWKYCDAYFGQYTVCHYWRPGNYEGQFQYNVMPLKE